MYSASVRNANLIHFTRRSLCHNNLATVSRTFTPLRTTSRCTRHVTRTSVAASRVLSSAPPLKEGKSLLPYVLLSLGVISAFAGGAKLVADYKAELMKEEKKKSRAEQGKTEKKGKALIGGPFNLVDTEGNKVTNLDFLGKWVLVYFGFTFCPDVCPEELEKIGDMLTIMDNTPRAPKITPIFISVDPKRDTPELIKLYLEDFHPEFIGLTGTMEQVKRATKQYRVYYSEGPDPGNNEYIVDHSIVTFLMDPRGEFSQNFGPNTTAEAAAEKIAEKMNDFYTATE